MALQNDREIRLCNRSFNIHEYNSLAVRMCSLPRYVMVELTRACNLSCSMCRSTKTTAIDGSMTSNLFNRIARELFGTAELVDLRGWGESLLVKDFSSKLQIAASLSQSVRLVTNLSIERDRVLNSLCEAHAYVAVSLDSADPDVLKVVRCGAQLNTIVSNLRKLTSLYIKRWGSVSRICINCTLQRPALSTLPKLADLAADTGVRDIRLSVVSISPMSYLSLTGYETDLHRSVTRLIEVAGRRGVGVTALTCLAGIGTPRECSQPCFHPLGLCLHKQRR